MPQINWNQWRANYATTSFTDQLRFYSQLAKDYPHQRWGSIDPIIEAFRAVSPRRVVEVGGWKGELATDAANAGLSFDSWTNYEISDVAVDPSAPSWYQHERLTDWVWNYEGLSKPDMLLFVHSAEHMLLAEVVKTVEAFGKPEVVLIQSPLDNEPINWNNFNGTHIIEVGWDGILEALDELGYKLIGSTNGTEKNDRTRTYQLFPVEVEEPAPPARRRSNR